MIGVVGEILLKYTYNGKIYEEIIDLHGIEGFALKANSKVKFIVDSIDYIEDTIYGVELSNGDDCLYISGNEPTAFEILAENISGSMELVFMSKNKFLEENYAIVITTTNQENSKEIAKALVSSKLAACVQMTEIDSVYEWKGEICFDKEVLMLIKTKDNLFDEVKSEIERVHNYELPEIIKVKIDDGNEEYLKWISRLTK
ncbi:MAG: divalent-cation tolerance protein CutA [Clostridia bacterium]|nr:divalent-cation tolerance protein CutA [Clostridia bacterium]